jgi:hypothetical protein
MVADEVDYAIGVDTHRDEHMLAAVTAPTGAVVAGAAVRTDTPSYRATLRFAARYAAGRRELAAVGKAAFGGGECLMGGCGRVPAAPRRPRSWLQRRPVPRCAAIPARRGWRCLAARDYGDAATPTELGR